jgi:hypothetical protein
MTEHQSQPQALARGKRFDVVGVGLNATDTLLLIGPVSP